MPWLSLLLFLAMITIIYFQTIHGTFSGIIMATLCVVCATLALGLHEGLAEDLLYDLIGDYSYSVSFVGIFAVSLIVLRILLDKFITRNTLLPRFIDRAGATVFGIVTGLITSGVIGVGLQMAPMGPEILGFERFDEEGKEHNLWLSPDKFTINLCGYLSDSTLGGPKSWATYHPDFLTELHWFRNTPMAGSRISLGGKGEVRATSLWLTSKLYSQKDSERRGEQPVPEVLEGPPPGKQWVGMSVKIGSKGKDSDGYYRASPTQVRLVGESGSSDGQRTEQYMLKAVGQEGVCITLDLLPTWGNKTGKFDFVFEVPKGFQPWFVEYKRSGRASLERALKAGEQLKERSPAEEPRVASTGGTVRSGSKPEPTGGATTPVRPKPRGSHFGNRLPMTIKRYTGAFLELGGDGHALKEGHIALYVDRQEQPTDQRGGRRGRGRGDDQGKYDLEKTTLDSFLVPSELRLLQLNAQAIHAQTTLAGALNLTRRVLQQYRVIDKHGESYWPAGLIAECDSAGDRIMEIQYFPEDAWLRSQIKPFQRIQYADLKGDYRLVFLFVVPPGSEIVTFDSGSRPVDISDQQLVAPN